MWTATSAALALLLTQQQQQQEPVYKFYSTVFGTTVLKPAV